MSTKPEHHEAVRAFVKNLKPPLKLSLAALETETPLGAYKVDRYGAQTAARPLLLQIRRGRRHKLRPRA